MKNTSAFVGENLEAVRSVILLSSAEHQAQGQTQRHNGRGAGNPFMRGNFGFRSRGRSRGFPSQYNGPINPGFNTRSLPTDQTVKVWKL